MLEETIEGMLSDDFRERLKAEHKQLSIRLNSLIKYIKKVQNSIFLKLVMNVY